MTHIQFQAALLGQQEKLLFYAMSLTSDTDHAQDLLQETYLKALTYSDKFTLNTHFKAWLCTIMKNTFINNYRRNKSIKSKFVAFDVDYTAKAEMGKGYPTPESIYNSKDIIKCIDALEDGFKIPFNMYIEGFKYKEIAESLNLPIGTIKSRIFCTRKKLEKTLKEYID